MTGTSVHLSTGYIEGLAMRLGKSEEEIRKALAEFQKAANSAGAAILNAADAGDFEVVFKVSCGDDSFPRLDSFITKLLKKDDEDNIGDDPSVIRVSDEEKKRREEEAARRARARKRYALEENNRARRQMGMPEIPIPAHLLD